MRSPSFDVAFDVGNSLGESPRWDHRTGRLVWVDIDAGRLWSATTDGTPEVLLDLDAAMPVVALAGEAEYLLGADRDLVHFDPATVTVGPPARIATRDDTRCNDGAVDAAGRFWVGSTAFDHGPGRASLFRVCDDGVTEVLSGVGMSNGIGWSVDNRRMYYIDTLTRRIDVFDFDLDAGLVSKRRPFAHVGETDGYPDGLTVDSEDRVWVVLWDGGAIRCYSHHGELLHDLALPMSRPTACSFGGADLSTLYVTSATSVDPVSGDNEAHAGSVMALSGIGQGLPANEASATVAERPSAAGVEPGEPSAPIPASPSPRRRLDE